MEGFRHAIEYIQYFVAIAGLNICSEETSQVMRYNLEKEVQNYTSAVLQKVSGTVYGNDDGK